MYTSEHLYKLRMLLVFDVSFSRKGKKSFWIREVALSVKYPSLTPRTHEQKSGMMAPLQSQPQEGRNRFMLRVHWAAR